MTTAQPTTLTRPWRKSSNSTGGNDCVEVAQAGTSCLVRDSKNPMVPAWQSGRRHGSHSPVTSNTALTAAERVRTGSWPGREPVAS